jgi:hypothetical protein
LLYAEGYVLIPGWEGLVAHGWNVTKGTGMIIDTTIVGEGYEYFGVVFNPEYVSKEIDKRKGTMPLIHNWAPEPGVPDGYQLIRDETLLDEALYPDWRWI